MVGQNVLLELVEGDKVQLYVYTSSGISDHKNSHYTQFIGCLLRPSVETLAAVMRRLGSSEAMEDDVSTAEDFSRKNGGDSSVRQRRGGSKSRVLSPPPQNGNGNNGNAVTNGNGVIKEEEEHSQHAETPAKKSAETPAEKSAEKGQNGEAEKSAQPQSYLALTKLGMGKKEENNNQPKASKKADKNGEKSNGNQNGKESEKVKRGKSMAEMATNTLKGFAKM